MRKKTSGSLPSSMIRARGARYDANIANYVVEHQRRRMGDENDAVKKRTGDESYGYGENYDEEASDGE
jgi:AICAR transformylase/IMP cyclohydrolase PurH